MRNQKGFSLLEVLIAFAIITIVAAAVYIMQSNSLFSSLKSKNLLIATNLARNFIEKSELELEAKEFNLLKEKEEGKFPEPYANFRWTREVKEQDFSSLSRIVKEASRATSGANDGDASDNAGSGNENQSAQDMVVKIFENYLKDSIRTLKISITWTEDAKPKTISVTTLLVRYDAQFRTSQ
jgi:prepilin-type N-terminal cleavage/methylation domain-containing protein